MALTVSETISTPLGLDLSSIYIRLEINDLYDGTLCVRYHAYSSKVAYNSGASSINKYLTSIDLSSYNNGVLASADHNRENIHDIAKAELLSRHASWVDGNISKVDIT